MQSLIDALNRTATMVVEGRHEDYTIETALEAIEVYLSVMRTFEEALENGPSHSYEYFQEPLALMISIQRDLEGLKREGKKLSESAEEGVWFAKRIGAVIILLDMFGDL